MIALLVAASLSVSTPTYLVERVAASGERTRRVSVFRDGTAVLALREGSEKPAVTRRRLDPVVLQSLKQVVEESYPELREFAGFEGAPGEAHVELRLAPTGLEALIVRLPVASVPSLAGARLMRAIDDVDAWLATYQPGQEDLSRWQPEVGQKVELADGTIVQVLALLNEGNVVQVRVGEGPSQIFFDLEELRERAVRRLSP